MVKESMSLKTLQQQFLERLYARDETALAALFSEKHLPAGAQAEIYTRHTFTALSDVLAQHYPAVRAIVGKKFLRSAARAYVGQHPQTGGNLEDYGAGFPAFLADFPAAKKLAYLPDVARLEWLVHESEMAEEKAALQLSDFAMAPEMFLQLRLTLHPSVRLFSSAYPAADLRRVALSEAEEEVSLEQGGQQGMIHKSRGEVKVRLLRKEDFRLLELLRGGGALLAAYEGAAALDPDFDLENALKNHIVQGIFSERGSV
jgi:hypothetical protein